MYSKKFSIFPPKARARGPSSSGGDLPSEDNFQFLMGGLTLIEIIIAASIFLIVSIIGWGVFSSFKKTNDLNTVADQAFAFLVEARSKTLSAENALEHGVHFESNSITFFQGALYTPGASSNQVLLMPTTVEMATTTLAGNGADVVFKRLTGETDNIGTVAFRLASDTAKVKIVTVEKTGLVTVE